LPQTLTLRHWILDQDGNPVTTLTATAFPANSVTIRNTRTAANLNGANFTVGATVTHLGNGVYERTLTLNAGAPVVSGDLLIVTARLLDATATDNQRLEASAAFNYGAGTPTGHRHVSVQPSTVTILGNGAAVPSATIRVRFYDQSGALFNGGAGTFTLNRWRDSAGATETVGSITSTYSTTNNEYTVTLSNISGMTANARQYVILSYTVGGILYRVPFSFVAVNPNPGHVIANPMFYNDPNVFP
jgi:hypothetical protein